MQLLSEHIWKAAIELNEERKYMANKILTDAQKVKMAQRHFEIIKALFPDHASISLTIHGLDFKGLSKEWDITQNECEIIPGKFITYKSARNQKDGFGIVLFEK